MIWSALIVGACFVQDPAVECRKCNGRGVVACTAHRRTLDVEQAVELCSEGVACKRCVGCLEIDCDRCKDEQAQNALEQRRELARAWLAGRRETVDAHAPSGELLHCRDAHIDLAWGVGPLTVGKRKLSPHELMHLYAARIAKLRARFVEVFDLRDDAFPGETGDTSSRVRVYVFDDRRDYERLTPLVTGLGAHGTSMKLMGPKIAYSVYRDRDQLRDDTSLHRNIAHGVTHLLVANTLPAQWIGNRGHGWLDEGIAHWFEFEVDGQCSTFCFEEVGAFPGKHFAAGKWKLGLRKQLEAGKLRSFVDLFGKQSDQLDFVDHAHVFAFIDFLIAEHGGPKLLELVKRIKQEEPTRDAMQAVYGFGPLEFDEPFREWVRETYPLRER